MNSEDFASAQPSSTQLNATFLSWLFDIVTRNFWMSRGGFFLIDVNPKGCEVEEHIATKS